MGMKVSVASHDTAVFVIGEGFGRTRSRKRRRLGR